MPQAIALNEAILILNEKRKASLANQAIWGMLNRAQQYLEAQMTAELHTL